MINILTRRELETINRKNFKYPLAIAEKDYFLAIVSKVIYNSHFRDKLVFKGGTALYHCYLSQLRFSEDLDFTSLDSHISLAEIKKVLESHDFLEVKKEYLSPATIKIEKLKYKGPLGLPNSLKIEIDYKQNVVLPAREIEYKNIWKIQTKVMVMDIKEICAEKIRAASDRARYRDFYDLFIILKNYQLNLKEIIRLIKKKEIRKPINKTTILANWKIVQKEKKKELPIIYYSEEVSNSEMEKMLKRFNFKKIA